MNSLLYATHHSHSMDNKYWVHLLRINPNNNPTWNINDPITFGRNSKHPTSYEKNNMAPGLIGIPIEFFFFFFF